MGEWVQLTSLSVYSIVKHTMQNASIHQNTSPFACADALHQTPDAL